jgi:hypothetical protein
MSKKFLLLFFLLVISMQNNFYSKGELKTIKLEDESDQATQIANIGKKMEDEVSVKTESLNKNDFLKNLGEEEAAEFKKLSEEEQEALMGFASLSAEEQEKMLEQLEQAEKAEQAEQAKQEIKEEEPKKVEKKEKSENKKEELAVSKE